ncbi:MAG: hypothetical protein OXG34_09355 [bacterium]|nr:hypothetical protein [bacterium]
MFLKLVEWPESIGQVVGSGLGFPWACLAGLVALAEAERVNPPKTDCFESSRGRLSSVDDLGVEEVDDNSLGGRNFADVVAIAMVELERSHLGPNGSPSSEMTATCLKFDASDGSALFVDHEVDGRCLSLQDLGVMRPQDRLVQLLQLKERMSEGFLEPGCHILLCGDASPY